MAKAKQKEVMNEEEEKRRVLEDAIEKHGNLLKKLAEA